MRTLRVSNLAVLLCLCGLFTISAGAQTFTPLASFNSTNGRNPGLGTLIQGTDGNFYGTTNNGGTYDFGAVYKVTPTGTITTLYSFCSLINCNDGKFPYSSLVQASDGNFYGTTNAGGPNGYGEIFKITPSGTFSVFYGFCSQSLCPDGQNPFAGVIQGTDGFLYGSTNTTIFKISTAGVLSTLYTFCNSSGCPNGNLPEGTLVQATNGNFYGITTLGGSNGCGTIFEITSAGKFTALHSLVQATEGCYPSDSLVQASNGNFYGTTSSGGANNAGTLFKITPAGALTVLYTFCSQTNCADGGYVHAGLMQATDGNFYGTTSAGAGGNGVVFEFTSSNVMTTLHTFSGPDGDVPYAALAQGTDGTFYGTTLDGGANNDGTVFNLSTGLGAFVKLATASGKVGSVITILGTNLTGASKVTFNGTSAAFTVVSASEITATVPSGATTGTVNVTTPTGTLKSNVSFRVTPQLTSFTPASGPVGTSVTITGVSLSKTSKVSFGGVSATSFTVSSDTQVKATVPTGAKTGKIQITTNGSTVTSATNFTVTAP